MDGAKNFAKVTLSAGYDDTATSVDLIFADGVKLPEAMPYNVVWWNATDYPDPADDPGVEIVRVTARVDDTLTITRAQENTAAGDHNLVGKTYKMIAALTAKTLGEIGAWRVAGNIEIDSGAGNQVFLGDILGAGSATTISVDDGDSVIRLDAPERVVIGGPLATTNSASASGPVGSIVAKLSVRDADGVLIGYLPIYGTIT